MTPILPDEEITQLADRFVSPGGEGREQLARDPFPFLARLRETAPVYRTSEGTWLVTSYAATRELLTGEGWLREDPTPEGELDLATRVFRRSIPFRDPPAHTRLRRAAVGMFTPRAVAAIREGVARRVNEAIEEILPPERFDFRQLAYRIPLMVISDLLGLPRDEVTDFETWATTLLHLGDAQVSDGVADRLRSAEAAATEAAGYFGQIIADRRRSPGDDIISTLVAAETKYDLTAEEIAAMCIIIHIGGHATTTDLLTNGVYRLLTHPAEWKRLKEDPELVPTAVEEFLRYDPPVFVALPRIAAREQEVSGTTIPEGAWVYAVLGAANRDPSVFENADRFDITRADNRHVAFAGGAHFCLGAHLARVEAQETLKAVVRQPRSLELAVPDSGVEWVDSFLHRGTTALPVAWTD